MCAADKCHKYDNCWSCPPACGTLEESRAKASGYDWGILLQSTGAMEDDFDVETMMGTEEEQKSRLAAFVEALDAEERYLPMASGACCIASGVIGLQRCRELSEHMASLEAKKG